MKKRFELPYRDSLFIVRLSIPVTVRDINTTSGLSLQSMDNICSGMSLAVLIGF